MCLFTCGDSRKGVEEEEIVVAARPRPMPPTIIRTTTTTVPARSRSASRSRNNVVVLEQLPSRTSRTSQKLYAVEPRRSNSRSPRGSATEVYSVERRRSQSRSPRTSNQQVVQVTRTRTVQITPPLSPVGILRPTAGPLQGTSPRSSSGRVYIIDPRVVDSEPARVATTLLRPVSSPAIPPPHRRSASQVVVINRTPSQRIRAAGPRLSDSILVQTGAAGLATAELITPRSRLNTAEVIIPSPVRATFEDITPRGSRLSQVSGGGGIVEIETAGGRRSRRTSTAQIFNADAADPRSSGTWRPARQKYVVIDAKGHKKEYYR